MRFVKTVSSMYEPLQLRSNSHSQKMKQALSLLISKLIGTFKQDSFYYCR